MSKLFVLAMLAVGCANNKQDPPTAGSASGPSGSGAVAAAPTPPPVTPPATPPPANPDLGSCTFTIAGAVTATETTPGGASAIGITHWMDATNKAVLANPGNEALLINCTGQNARV